MTSARRAARLAAVVGIALASSPRADAAEAPVMATARAFTVTADAFPVEPAPGSNQTTLGIRPVSTRAGARNPPAASFARAAATDLGLIEAYVGQRGPSAEADTASANGQRDAHIEQGGMVLDAHASPAPKAHATAVGNDGAGGGLSFGSSRSASSVDGSGAAVVATSSAEVQDVISGPLRIGSARFDAAAAADGRPGGARASGRVTASDATVAGVPVVLGDSGVRVNEAAVPAEQLPLLTETVRNALNRGGYVDVRVVQPVVETTQDGLLASVRGGGVRIRMATNDPSNNYFMEVNLVAGSAVALLGPLVGTAPSSPPPGGSPPPGAVGGAARVNRPDGFAPSIFEAADPVPTAAPEAPVATEDVAAFTDAAAYRLRDKWPGWPWLLAGLVATAALAASLTTPPMAPARRRLSLFADRYLRG